MQTPENAAMAGQPGKDGGDHGGLTGRDPMQSPPSPSSAATCEHGFQREHRVSPGGQADICPGPASAALAAIDRDLRALRERLAQRIRLGCSTISHDRLGYCSGDVGVDAADELLGWRLLALREREERDAK